MKKILKKLKLFLFFFKKKKKEERKENEKTSGLTEPFQDICSQKLPDERQAKIFAEVQNGKKS
jgi:hypothetical protein